MATFLTVAGVTALAILLGAGVLHLIPKLGSAGRSLSAALCRAPGLDLVVTYFTVAPLFVGPIVGGWAGLAGGVAGQVAGMLAWQWLHELTHLRATRGPRVVKVLNRLFGRWRNHTAVWLTALVTPIFWVVRVAEVAVYPLIAIALRQLSPVVVVFGRVALAALLLTPVAVRHDALRPLWKHPRMIIETVLVQSTLPLLLLTIGQRHVDAGLAAILIGAQPVFVALLAYRWAPEQRPCGPTGILGIALGVLGLMLLFGLDLRGGRSALVGGGLVLAAAGCYAAGTIMIHRRHADVPPLGVATSAMLVTTVALAAPTVAALPRRVPTADVLAAMAVLGVVCTGCSLVLFYTLIVHVGPARAALAFYLSPGFAVAFGAVFLAEELTASAAAGLLAIVTGSLLAAHRTEPAPP